MVEYVDEAEREAVESRMLKEDDVADDESWDLACSRSCWETKGLPRRRTMGPKVVAVPEMSILCESFFL